MAKLVDAATVLAGLSAVAVAATVILRGSNTSGPLVERETRRVDNWQEYVEEGHRIGPPNAAVVVVEFGDYQCPVCRYAFQHLESATRNRDDVAVVYRHFPLSYHQMALPAVRAVECADRQGMFPQLHRFLYSAEELSQASLREAAREVQLPDTTEYLDCIARTDPVRQAETDRAAARRLGVSGTPTFLVNGLLLNYAPDSTEWRELIEAAR